MFTKEKQPNRDFRKGVDAEDKRRVREGERLRLRRKDREERLQKRRNAQSTNVEQPSYSPAYQMGFQIDPNLQQMLQELPNLVSGVWTEDPNIQYENAQKIRKLLSIERNPPIQQVIDSGVVPRLVQFLRCSETTKLQFEAAWALTNIASGNAEHTSTVIRNGAVPTFVELLRSSSPEVVEQAVWALGNIAGDSPECRNLVLENNALPMLLPLCNPQQMVGSNRISLLRNGTWTLSNFCRGKPQPSWKHVKDALPALSVLLHVSDEEVLTDACWAFSYLSDVDSGAEDQRISAIIHSGALKRLVDLLDHKANNVKHPALRTIGNIVTGDDMQTQQVINVGALVKLLDLLKNEKKSIKKEACWTISNITAGNVEQIDAVIRANLIQPLVQLLRNDEFDVKKEAAWALSNATSGGNPQQIRFLVHQGCIAPLCELFECSNPKIIMVALEGIENILRIGEMDRAQFDGVNKFAQHVEECGGLDKLEQLQGRDDVTDDVFEKAASIVRNFFEGTEEDDELAPDTNQQQFTFGTSENPPDQQTPFTF